MKNLSVSKEMAMMMDMCMLGMCMLCYTDNSNALSIG